MTMLKCLDLGINIVVTIVISLGLLVTCGGIVVVAYLRTDVTPNLFYPMGIFVALYGLIEMVEGYIHLVALAGKAKKKGFWTGRKMMILSYLLVVGLTIYDLYALYTSYTYYEDLQKASDNANPTKYSEIESKLAKYFNQMFFQASYLCNGTDGSWFWQLIQNRCPEAIHQVHCTNCYVGSVKFCAANQQVCYMDMDIGPACPYALCRTDMLSFVTNWISGPFIAVPALFLILHVATLLLSCPFLCYEHKAKATIRVVPVADDGDVVDEKKNSIAGEASKATTSAASHHPPASSATRAPGGGNGSNNNSISTGHRYHTNQIEVVDLEKDGKKKAAAALALQQQYQDQQAGLGLDDLNAFIDADFLVDHHEVLGGYEYPSRHNVYESPKHQQENGGGHDEYEVQQQMAILFAIQQQEEAMKESIKDHTPPHVTYEV